MKNDLEMEEDKKQKPARVSRFASRMAKKKSNLDRKLSKMKSKLRDVEDRKEELAIKDTEQADIAPESTDALVADSDSVTPGAQSNVNEPVLAQEDSFPESDTESTAKRTNEADEQIPPANEIVSQKESEQRDSPINKDKDNAGELLPKTNDEDKDNENDKTSTRLSEKVILHSEKSNNDEGDKATDEKKVSKLTSPINDSVADTLTKPAAKANLTTTQPEKRSLAAKPKPPGLTGIGGLGGRGNKKVKPATLLHKIIDRLDESDELKFISGYREKFLFVLKNLHQHSISLSWICNHLPAEVDHNVSHILLTGADVSGDQLRCENINQNLERFVNSTSLGSLFITTWENLTDITPEQSAQLRQFTDIHIIQDLPKSPILENLIPCLERISRNSGALIIAPLSLKSVITKQQSLFEINRGYSVIDEERICYIDEDLSQNNIKWLDELLSDEDTINTFTEFSVHRQIMCLAQMLETSCDNEITKLEFIEGMKNPKFDEQKLLFSVAEFDVLMKNTIAQTKLLLGSKGIQVDEYGQITFATKLNESESAQALVSELSIDDLVREDELDVLKFGSNQRASVNRIKRFRFASKLGFLWKLKPEYIENLHKATSDLVLAHTRKVYKQTTQVIDKNLAQMSLQGGLLPSSSSLSNAFEQFKSTWKNDVHVTQAVANYNDLNHFRSAVFSKRGNAAPIEAQRGVLKELRESRMFVSQLMAFGMLGAVLLGSSYAVDVFFSWFSGGPMNVGEELTQAAKSSRGLGRQVRILIAGVAGICIVFYLCLRMYLRNSEKILDQQRIVGVYAQQLEDVVANFITESSNLAKEIITADLERLQLQFEEFKNSLPAQYKDTGRKRTDSDGARSAGLGQAGPVKRIEELKKWLSSILSERENISIIQSQKTALGEAQQRLNQ